MLRNEMPRHRVQAHAQQRANNKVNEALGAKQEEDSGVEGDLHRPVSSFPEGRLLRHHQHRPQGVEGRLQQHPDRFQEAVGEDLSFCSGWDVSVDAVLALVLVVLHMVAAERSAQRSPMGAKREVGRVNKRIIVLATSQPPR